MFFGFSFGAAVAGLVAAPLLPRYGWPAVFFVGGTLPLLLAPVLLAALPESVRILTLRGTAAPRVAAVLRRIDPGAAFAAGTRFVIREEKAPGLPVRHLFREGRAPSTLLLWVMFFANLLCLFFLTSWLPTVMGRSGVDLRVAVIAASLLQFGGCVGTLVCGPLIDRFGAFAVLTAIYATASVFIALIGAASLVLSPESAMLFESVPLSAVPIMVAISAAGFCVIGGQNAMNAAAAMIYPTYIRSTGVGWALGIGRIGAILGPVLGGAMLAFGWPIVGMFVIAAIPALTTALATFVLGRVEARRAAAERGLAYAETRLAPASEG
jgi:AAHS family 4-hydroxybenzoate transporter-like MFS transporter